MWLLNSTYNNILEQSWKNADFITRNLKNVERGTTKICSLKSKLCVTGITFPALDRETKARLATPFSNEEVKNAIFNMRPWKAPGPNGFLAGFYQKSWRIIGSTVCEFVKRVCPSLIVKVNQTDIFLIPKVASTEFVKQIRPISLCNTNYKIITKIMVDKLKECISNLVSRFQTGFILGQNIHDNIVLRYHTLCSKMS